MGGDRINLKLKDRDVFPPRQTRLTEDIVKSPARQIIQYNGRGSAGRLALGSREATSGSHSGRLHTPTRTHAIACDRTRTCRVIMQGKRHSARL